MSRSTSPLRVLLGVSGGIAAYKAAELVRRLKDRGHSVRCAMTRSAEAFIPALTLEVLSGEKVYRQEYLGPTDTGEELHVTAAAWADVLCVAPATAHTLGRLALGLADDFLSTTALAFAGPVVVAPAMHAVMWGQPAVEANVETLRRRGVVFAGPVEGPLASGEIGMGRLAAPEEIVAAVEKAAAEAAAAASAKIAPLFGRTVLVSAGPTHEPLDPVRFLGNHSSGKMGFALAAEAARRGARVVLVAGPVTLPTPEGVERVDVTTALEMEKALHAEAGRADLVIMCAAVADFRPVAPAEQKIKKSAGGLPRLELEANPDILAGLEDAAPQALRVGFAAETEQVERHALAKLESKGAHFIVANDVSRSDIGFGHEANEVTVYGREPRFAGPYPLGRRSKARLAGDLLDLFTDALGAREPREQREPSSVVSAG